ncbi:hypothetical protein ALC53_05630, partial [Atta colombica]
DAHFIIKEIATAMISEKLRFIDSFKFLSTNLNKLASYFDKDKLKIVHSEFFYPLGEYRLVLENVLMLLADIFENFRNSCVPDFTWDAMLKHMRVKFELLTDIDMIVFIQRSIRGDFSQYSSKYVQANNKYMMYYDVNNLYGWAMCQPLLYAEFRWSKMLRMRCFDVSAITPDSSIDYILEVDLEYSQHLHTFDKTMENVRNHVDVKLIKLIKWDGSSTSSIYVGICILDIDYEDAISLDSTRAMYPHNVYDTLLRIKKIVRVDGKKDTKKVKGIKNNVVARTITFNDYTRCLNEEINMTRHQSCITISESKIALNPYNDKRYIVPHSMEDRENIGGYLVIYMYYM